MKLAFLGLSTYNKRFLILCLAKITSFHTKVSILTKYSYTFKNTDSVYDLCGIEIIQYESPSELFTLLPDDGSVFVDIEDVLDLSDQFRVVTICEPTRQELEFSVWLTNEIILRNPSLVISFIYLNIMEYGKVSKRFIDLFWERNITHSTLIAFTHTIYFEEINLAMMIDSQYTNKIPIKRLSLAFKGSIKGIIQDVFKLDPKVVRDILKKAEREK